MDTEEKMSELYNEGDLDRGKLDEAEQHFAGTMELSRKRLPRWLTPRLFKTNDRGKPYRRGSATF